MWIFYATLPRGIKLININMVWKKKKKNKRKKKEKHKNKQKKNKAPPRFVYVYPCFDNTYSLMVDCICLHNTPWCRGSSFRIQLGGRPKTSRVWGGVRPGIGLAYVSNGRYEKSVVSNSPKLTRIGHLRVVFCLCFKTILRAKSSCKNDLRLRVPLHVNVFFIRKALHEDIVKKNGTRI